MSESRLKVRLRKLARHYFCELAGHRRSRAKARRRGYAWVSECTLCGTPLERVGPKFWVETKKFDVGRHSN